MKKIIYFLLVLCAIMNQKIITQASNQISNLNLYYADSISDNWDWDDDYDDYDDDYDDYLDDLDDKLDNISTNYSSSTESQDNNTITIIITLIVYIIQGLIFGYATQTVIYNKRYEENWFWWGFFFGFIALLVAIAKPELHYSTSDEQTFLRGFANEATGNRIMREGGWECAFCHAKNQSIVLTCACGKSKDDTDEKNRLEEKKRTEQQQSAKNHSESNTIELLQKYKDLLDSGTITQEEFDEKKKQLLGK